MVEIKWAGYPKSYTEGRRRPVQFVVVHATHGAEGYLSAENGASWDKRRPDPVSCHIFVDADSAVREVPDADRAHHARFHGNEIGLGLEICGRADQTAAQWDDDVSRRTLRVAANVTAQLCKAHNLPVRRLSVAETRAAYYGQAGARPRGIVGHVDVTKAFPEDLGDHWDPGPAFPWGPFLTMVQFELNILNGANMFDEILGPTDSTTRRWSASLAQDKAGNWLLRAAMYAWDAKVSAQANTEALTALTTKVDQLTALISGGTPPTPTEPASVEELADRVLLVARELTDRAASAG